MLPVEGDSMKAPSEVPCLSAWTSRRGSQSLFQTDQRTNAMSDLHKRAMEAVLQAAEHDVVATLQERAIKDSHSEEADEAVLDVAILHAWRIFVRICEQRGLTVDAGLFAELAGELADELAQDQDYD